MAAVPHHAAGLRDKPDVVLDVVGTVLLSVAKAGLSGVKVDSIWTGFRIGI